MVDCESVLGVGGGGVMVGVGVDRGSVLRGSSRG